MDIGQIREAGQRIRVGAWVRAIPVAGFTAAALRVRGINNPDARILREKLAREAAAEKKDGAEVMDAVTDAILAETILLDWDLTEGGEPLACTPEAASRLLADPDIGPLLREATLYAASVVAERGAESLESAAKNSAAP